MSSSAYNHPYDHYARYRRDASSFQENGLPGVGLSRPFTLPPPPYQSYEGTYVNYVAPTPKPSTSPGLQFDDHNLEAWNQSFDETFVNFVPPTPNLSASPGLQFDEYEFEALDAIKASLEANKRYCYRFDQTQRSIQSSPEAVSKRILLAGLCTQFVLKRFPYHSGEHSTALYHDILTVLHELSSDGEAAHGALLLLERVRKLCDKETYPKESSQFELFLAAFIISHKFLEDRSHTSTTWVTVSNNKFTPQYIEKMQKRMFRVLDWNVSFTGHELSASKMKISQEFRRRRPHPL